MSVTVSWSPALCGVTRVLSTASIDDVLMQDTYRRLVAPMVDELYDMLLYIQQSDPKESAGKSFRPNCNTVEKVLLQWSFKLEESVQSELKTLGKKLKVFNSVLQSIDLQYGNGVLTMRCKSCCCRKERKKEDSQDDRS